MAPARPHFRPVLFDFDGTVADTQTGIVAALARALGEVGLPALDAARVHPLTGRGGLELVAGALAELTGERDAALAARVAARYAEHYAELCAAGSTLYPGLDRLLGALPPPLALLTNKARRFTDIILDELGLTGRFDVVVAGDDVGAERKPSPWGIHQALDRLGGEAHRAILVGDTASDIQAGVAAGVATCAVGWGFGGATARAGARFQADTVAELEALLWRGG